MIWTINLYKNIKPLLYFYNFIYIIQIKSFLIRKKLQQINKLESVTFVIF